MPAESAMSRTVVARRPRSANIVAARSSSSSRRLGSALSTGSDYQPSACSASRGPPAQGYGPSAPRRPPEFASQHRLQVLPGSAREGTALVKELWRNAPLAEVADLDGLLVGRLARSDEGRPLGLDVASRRVPAVALLEHPGHRRVLVVGGLGEEVTAGGVAAVVPRAGAPTEQGHHARGCSHGHRHAVHRQPSLLAGYLPDEHAR